MDVVPHIRSRSSVLKSPQDPRKLIDLFLWAGIVLAALIAASGAYGIAKVTTQIGPVKETFAGNFVMYLFWHEFITLLPLAVFIWILRRILVYQLADRPALLSKFVLPGILIGILAPSVFFWGPLAMAPATWTDLIEGKKAMDWSGFGQAYAVIFVLFLPFLVVATFVTGTVSFAIGKGALAIRQAAIKNNPSR